MQSKLPSTEMLGGVYDGQSLQLGGDMVRAKHMSGLEQSASKQWSVDKYS